MTKNFNGVKIDVTTGSGRCVIDVQMQTSSAGLLVEKTRCRIIRHERHVICDSGVAVDVAHFLVIHGEHE